MESSPVGDVVVDRAVLLLLEVDLGAVLERDLVDLPATQSVLSTSGLPVLRTSASSEVPLASSTLATRDHQSPN